MKTTNTKRYVKKLSIRELKYFIYYLYIFISNHSITNLSNIILAESGRMIASCSQFQKAIALVQHQEHFNLKVNAQVTSTHNKYIESTITCKITIEIFSDIEFICSNYV